MSKLVAAVVTVLLLAIYIMFRGTDDPEFQKQLLQWVDMIVPFVVGAGAGGLSAFGLVRLRETTREEFKKRIAGMTVPLAIVVCVLMLAIAMMVGEALDTQVRDHLVGYFDAVVPFVLGAGLGGAGSFFFT